ncbi:uncharacterized protein PgNI_01851 [Pyricularia grisea]|uniref:Uncharacterized protein n=1 Tax=Pyricularia grisea TaxID=148305 RepID=A0A6P8BI04_PYRGI|nr:uncharacterized protein PgNI_01851 [Pyricularia grisea]TLD16511.1 hypothetical protein PgNI_01851 [Pyricularia grisea]
MAAGVWTGFGHENTKSLDHVAETCICAWDVTTTTATAPVARCATGIQCAVPPHEHPTQHEGEAGDAQHGCSADGHALGVKGRLGPRVQAGAEQRAALAYGLHHGEHGAAPGPTGLVVDVPDDGEHDDAEEAHGGRVDGQVAQGAGGLEPQEVLRDGQGRVAEGRGQRKGDEEGAAGSHRVRQLGRGEDEEEGHEVGRGR